MVLRTRVCAGCLSRALLLAGMTAWPIRTSGERDESAAAEAPWRRLQQGGENPRVEQFPGIGYQMDVNGDGRVSSQEFDDWTQESRAQQFGSAVTTQPRERSGAGRSRASVARAALCRPDGAGRQLRAGALGAGPFRGARHVGVDHLSRAVRGQSPLHDAGSRGASAVRCR